MRNALILGSGRSGTSMLAGTLARAGWFCGAKPYGARASNPKGFFESAEINGINEYLLARAVPAGEGAGPWQRWLARTPEAVECVADERVERRIRAAVTNEPWCFKDPRLCTTLPAWRPHVGDAALLCVFRHPSVTVRSILKECRDEAYLRDLPIDAARAFDGWNRMYRRILDRHVREGDWLFLSYEQILTAPGLDKVEAFVGAPIHRDFPDAALRRTRSEDDVPADVAETWAELCSLAGCAPEPSRTAVAIGAVALDPPDALATALGRLAERRGWAPAPETLDSALARARRELRLRIEASAADPRLAAATREACEEYVVERLPRIPTWERAVAELAPLRPAVLDDARASAASREILSTLSALLEELVEVALREELLELFERHGASCVDELRPDARWPIASAAPVRALAWPDWTDADLDALWTRFGRSLAREGEVALCLRFDPSTDGDRPAAEARLAESYSRALPDRPAVDVVILDEPIPAAALPRLGRAASVALALPSNAAPERASWLDRVAAPVVGSAPELERRIARRR